MDVNPSDIDLTAEQRQRLARLAEQMGRNWTELVDNLLDAAPVALCPQPTAATGLNGDALEQRTLYDVLAERGILGCFDGPTDLSTNPRHMEGFGESCCPKNSG